MAEADQATLAFYTREARAYADHTEAEAENPVLARFSGMVAPGGHVLDFGSGPGWAANRFRSMGFEVSAVDGSEGLAAEAKRRYGLNVKVMQFDAFSDVDAYDGIWASFCLLHDRREAMPGHLARLHRALKPGGALYVGLKEGTGEERDGLDRRYTYFTMPEMEQLLTVAGFCEIAHETEESTGMSGVPAIGLHIFARRA